MEQQTTKDCMMRETRNLLLSMLILALVGCAETSNDDDDVSDDDVSDDDTGDDDTGDDDTGDDDTVAGTVQVSMETTLGTMVIELDEELAPITVANFLTYVDEGFYDGTDGLGATTFHRVMSGFMIQGGGLTEDLTNKATHDPIVNESYNGLSNLRGTIAMARTNVPDSATSQFYINHVDNTSLDIDGQFPPGYAVFGEVVEGLDVVDTIAAVPTGTVGQYADVPDDPITILSVVRI
jgi:cyclophilin family peptidyl-prolyl cis-trans isomerase